MSPTQHQCQINRDLKANKRTFWDANRLHSWSHAIVVRAYVAILVDIFINAVISRSGLTSYYCLRDFHRTVWAAFRAIIFGSAC